MLEIRPVMTLTIAAHGGVILSLASQGTGTAAHAAALDRHGVTPHHRASFRPIRERLERG